MAGFFWGSNVATPSSTVLSDYSVHASHPSTVKIKCLSSFPLHCRAAMKQLKHIVGKGRGMLLFFFGGLSENREPTGRHVLVNHHCPSPPAGPFEGFSNALKHSSESKSAGDFHHFDGINMDQHGLTWINNIQYINMYYIIINHLLEHKKISKTCQ